MKKTLLLAGVATALFAMNANAIELNPYVGAKFRYVDMTSEYTEPGYSFDVDDKVMGGSIAIGTAVKTDNGAVRVELEYNQNENVESTLYGVAKAEVETQSVMLNGYYDIDTGTKLTPYVGGGLGYAKVKGIMTIPAASYYESMDDNNFAWQLGAGVGYAVTENVTVDAGYRYADYGDFSKNDVTLDTSAHELYVGARYTF